MPRRKIIANLKMNSISVGIDLAGVEHRETGYCRLDENLSARTCILHTDTEIVEKVLSDKPEIVAIDAPLALPKGRKSLEVRNDIHLRECDRELLKMRIRFFPITLGPMRKLTIRGIGLKRRLEEREFRVVETYPGAVQDLLKMPRKKQGLEELRKALIDYGVKVNASGELTGDELDTITCALAGKKYLEGDYLAIGEPDEAIMILPKTRAP